MNPHWRRCGSARTEHGSSLIELLVTLCIFAVLAVSLGGALANCWRLKFKSERRTRAVELAAQDMERILAGNAREDSDTNIGGFQSSATITRVGRMDRIDITVTWNDSAENQFVLSTLRRHPAPSQWGSLP